MAYSSEQRHEIALARRLSARDASIIRRALLEAMAVESSFRNLNYGDRDSQGVLQQRPSQGWGAPGNPAQDINQFLARARATLSGGFHGTAGQLAQAVQHSAFPGRYDQHRGEVNALLGGGGGNLAPVQSSPSGPVAAGAGDPRQTLLQALIGASQEKNPPYQGVIAALGQLHQADRSSPPASFPSSSRAGGGTTRAVGGKIAELFYDPLGAIKNGHSIPAIGGHGDHVHFSASSPQQMLAAIRQAQAMGLHVGENPYVGAVNPVHVSDSYHYRTFPGKYGGRRLGEAIDVSGNSRQMAQFFRWVRSHL